MDTIKDILSQVTSIHFDSRQVQPNSLFVAIKGGAQDGNAFISDAIQKGATIIVHENEILQKTEGVKYFQVVDTREALADIAQAFYNYPSTKLKLIGVTGTNGKTTTATLLFNIFRSLNYHVALLSTIENKIDDDVFPATHTTPDPIALAAFLAKAVDQGCTYAFMECSSHTIDQKRITGLTFAGAVFTNLTHDHLDYHKTVEAYAKAKKGLFDMLPANVFALANAEDTHGKYMLTDTLAHKHTFSLKDPNSDFYGKILNQSLEGLILLIQERDTKKEVHTKLIGTFNAYNILGIYATTKLLGIPEEKIISSIALLIPPKGRLEFMKSPSGIYTVVDYAHTPDALANVLRTLREVILRDKKIITVVGCGGDRDKTKRPIMAQIACELSGYVVFTSDNPRNENPEDILQDMTHGLSTNTTNHMSITDRREAIRTAYGKAQLGDMLLIAGKGHEEYQIASGITTHFSDVEELQKLYE